MAQDGAVVTQIRVDGGMVVNNWLCQFLADILDVTVERPRIIETTALGAASLAALGAGLTSELDEQIYGLDRTFIPDMQDGRRQALLTGWKVAVEQAFAGYRPVLNSRISRKRDAGLDSRWVESGDLFKVLGYRHF